MNITLRKTIKSRISGCSSDKEDGADKSGEQEKQLNEEEQEDEGVVE